MREVLDVAHTLENDRGPACQGAEEALSPTEESFSPTSPPSPPSQGWLGWGVIR